MQNKKIVILGGAGNIGELLEKGLAPHYKILIADKGNNKIENKDNYLEIDITDFEQLKSKIPDDAYAIINLVGLQEKEPTVSAKTVGSRFQKSVLHCFQMQSGAFYVRRRLRKVPSRIVSFFLLIFY